MRAFICAYFILLVSANTFSEDSVKDYTFTPLLNYEYLSFDGQHIHSSGEGIIFAKGNMNPSISEERDSLSVAGTFRQYFILDEQNGYPNLYHNININIDRKIKQHLFIGALFSKSDMPFYGGLRSFTAGLGYGYEFIRTENMSLTLGMGFGVGYFGIELPNDKPLSAMPIPIVRFNLDTSLLNLSFNFLTNPNLNITLFPEYKVRLVNTFRIYKFRDIDIRDFLFDITIMYRFYSGDSGLGDFAGIGIGIKNDTIRFTLAEKDKNYELIYNSIYGMLDLSFLKIYGGYSFNGIEIYDLNRKKDIGNGFFVNVLLGWKF